MTERDDVEPRPTVILLHSSVAGARQWRGISGELQSDFNLVAPDLLGYGSAPAWDGSRPQRLQDQVDRIAPLLPQDGGRVHVVGHSFGGSVAMQLAVNNRDRVDRLVLIEPNPFSLLAETGRDAAYGEVRALRDCIKENGDLGNWQAAAEVFADYWNGARTWRAMPDDRRFRFAMALKPNFHEWDAVMNDRTPLAYWRECLPETTTLIWAQDTVRSIRELVDVLAGSFPNWQKIALPEGGHMATLTRPAEVAKALRRTLE